MHIFALAATSQADVLVLQEVNAGVGTGTRVRLGSSFDATSAACTAVGCIDVRLSNRVGPDAGGADRGGSPRGRLPVLRG